ncbi:MAG: 6-hydroxymethylpterin diphosphokinase MptE-like protein [Flexilinea sp.]
MIKQIIKKTIPVPLLNTGKQAFDGLKRLGNIPEAYFSDARRDSISRLAALKDTHKGQRCFIMGNGPSLKNTDLSKLKNEFTFGLNRIYLAFPEMGFETTYYLCVNDLVVEQTSSDIRNLRMPRFVTTRAMKWLKPAENLFFLYSTYTGPTFAKDIRKRMWEGATVTYMALQTAFYLGFQQVILIGVDHSFATKGKPNETVTSQGDDPNHFNPGYFGKGFRWQLPDLDTSERSYTLARETYKAAGREVIDATIGGKLQIFPKVDYNSLF